MKKNKGGFLSPKAINNRIKSKGLQKLRWYCQMCQKQCIDAVNFFIYFFILLNFVLCRKGLNVIFSQSLIKDSWC